MAAGTVEGMHRWSYDGTELAGRPTATVQTAQITTRDIDRGAFPHFLLKEITDVAGVVPQDAARQARRGRRRRAPRGARPRVAARRRATGLALGAHRPDAGDRPGHRGGRRPEPGAPPGATSWPSPTCRSRPCPPPSCRASDCAPTCPTRWSSPSASPAPPPTPTAPSTWSGPAAPSVIAIVNRRNSDLTDKSDGVLYTSDGRDVEMSVASTKAFYSQVAAGLLLAHAIADEVPGGRATDRPRRAAGAAAPRCGTCPPRMEATLGVRPAIGRGGPDVRPQPSLLGDRRQRREPDRRPGDPDQAVRALLQVDRLRRHRGQEAHRPVVRADDPGVRRRSGRLHRGRRRQGGRDLPGPQGGADRDRVGGRPGLRRGRSRC